MNICSDPVVLQKGNVRRALNAFFYVVFVVFTPVKWSTFFLRFFYSWFSKTVEVSRASWQNSEKIFVQT